MGTPTILIIDDDRLTRWSLSRILERAGYQIREAGSLTEGATALESQRPDVILLDIRLPDGDGFALLKAVQLGHLDLPVIMITAHASPESKQAALALGARGYLAKPCDPTELQAIVGDALARGAS